MVVDDFHLKTKTLHNLEAG